MFSRFASTKTLTRLLPVRSRISLLNSSTYYCSTPHFKWINYLLISSSNLLAYRSFSSSDSNDSTRKNLKAVNSVTPTQQQPSIFSYSQYTRSFSTHKKTVIFGSGVLIILLGPYILYQYRKEPMTYSEIEKSLLTDKVKHYVQMGDDAFAKRQFRVAEKNYHNALRKIASVQKREEHVIVLIKIADLYLFEKRYHDAATLYNTALSMCSALSDKSYFQKILINKIDLVEKKLLCNEFELSDVFCGGKSNIKNKRELVKIRDNVTARIEEIKKSDNHKMTMIQELVKELNLELKLFLQNIILESFKPFQKAPCPYAFIGLGSLARGEMTHYSDIEYCILISESNESYRNYFKRVFQLFELKIINLGETSPHHLLPPDIRLPLKIGVTLDKHKRALNKEHNLIATPSELADYQLAQKYVHSSDNHLSASLLSAAVIIAEERGREKLFSEYRDRLNDRLLEDDPNGKSRRKNIAMKRIKEDLRHIRFTLEDEESLFSIKRDFYRFPNITIDVLAVLYGLENLNSLQRIEELEHKGIFTKKASENLKKAFTLALWLRLQIYTHYKSNIEFLSVQSDDQYLCLSEQREKDIFEFFKVLIPLHSAIANISHHPDGFQKHSFLDREFYDDSPSVQGKIAARLGKYELSERWYRKALEESLKVFGSTHPETAEIYHQLGLVLGRSNKDIKNAIGYIDQAGDIYGQDLGQFKLKWIDCRVDLGAAYLCSQDYKNSKRVLEEVLKISIDYYQDPRHKNLSTIYSNLALIYHRNGDFNTAKDYLEKINQPSIIQLNNMVYIYTDLKNYDLALKCAKNALEQALNFFSTHDKRVSKLNNSVGYVLFFMGRENNNLSFLNEALTYFQKALSIDEAYYKEQKGQKDSDFATNYNNIGGVYRLLNDPKKALEYYHQALAIDRHCKGNVEMKIILVIFI